MREILFLWIAITDKADKAQRLLGHESAAMTEHDIRQRLGEKGPTQI